MMIFAALLIAALPAASAQEPVRVATCGGFLEGAALAPDGNVWAVDVSGGRILEITPDGRCVERARVEGHPNGAKFAADGRLVVAAGSGLYAYDPKRGRLARLPVRFEGAALAGFNDLAFDRDGGLYLTVHGTSDALHPTGRLFYLPRESSDATLVAGGLAFPNGVAVGADGKAVLVAEFATKRILSIPPAGERGPMQIAYVFAHTQGGVGPDGIQVDRAGRVHAAILGSGTIASFEADGTPRASEILPPPAGLLVTNLAIAPDAVYVTEGARGEVWRLPTRR